MAYRNRVRNGWRKHDSDDDDIPVYTEDDFKYGGDPQMRREVLKLKNTPADLHNLKCDVKSILVTASSELRVSDICIEYLKFVGRPLPYRQFSFACALELLETLTDACEIDNPNEEDPIVRPKGIEKCAHIKELVKKNVKRVPRADEIPGPDLRHRVNKKVSIPYYVQDRIRYMLFQNRGAIRKEAFYEDLQQEFPLKELCLDIGIKGFVDALPYMLCTVDNKVKSTYRIEKSEIFGLGAYAPGQWTAARIRKSKQEVRMGERVQQIVEMHPTGLELNELPREYLRVFKSKFCVEELGFVWLHTLVMLLPGNYKMVYKDGMYVLLPASFADDSEGEDYRDPDYLTLVGERGLNELRKKIQRMAIDELHNVNTTQFLNCLMGIMCVDILFRHQKISKEDFMIKLAKENVIELKEKDGKLIVMPNAAWTFTEELTIQAPLMYPEYVVKPGEFIPEMELPDVWIDDRRGFWAQVVSLRNPTDFHCRALGIDSYRDEENEFNKFMEEMNDYYYKNYRKYEISTNALEYGMTCTCSIKGMYRRIKILGPANSNSTYVEDIDTGHPHTVATSHILFLDRKHMLEIRTFRCTLVNIKPRSIFWNLNTVIQFERFVHRKRFYLHMLYRTEDFLHVELKQSVRHGYTATGYLIQHGFALPIADTSVMEKLYTAWDLIEDDLDIDGYIEENIDRFKC